MAERENNGHSSISNSGGGFRISQGPVVRFVGGNRRPDLAGVVELPRVYGPPVLFAVARDPETIFAYWNIDWPSVFEKTAPVDRQVHLRVYRRDGTEATSAAVEPMAGSCYLEVPEPRVNYRVEIGYYRPENVWNCVTRSEEVAMPPDRVSENLDVDLATIPFHLSFQRLVNLFRASNGNALAAIIGRLQKRSLTDEERRLLTAEEWEILRAMNFSLEEMESARRALMGRAKESSLRRRAEALLGFGAASPSRGFGESSWTGSSRSV
jgi:Domain of unknown function (DUF4912)